MAFNKTPANRNLYPICTTFALPKTVTETQVFCNEVLIFAPQHESCSRVKCELENFTNLRRPHCSLSTVVLTFFFPQLVPPGSVLRWPRRRSKAATCARWWHPESRRCCWGKTRPSPTTLCSTWTRSSRTSTMRASTS